jgi:hypothetical protein
VLNNAKITAITAVDNLLTCASKFATSQLMYGTGTVIHQYICISTCTAVQPYEYGCRRLSICTLII